MPIQLVETSRRLRHLQIPTTPETAPTVTGAALGYLVAEDPNGGRRIWPNCLVNPYSSVQARLRNSRAKDGSWYTDLTDRFWSSKNRIECTPWTTGVRTWAFHSIVAAWRMAF